jgi:hypothetical protein
MISETNLRIKAKLSGKIDYYFVGLGLRSRTPEFDLDENKAMVFECPVVANGYMRFLTGRVKFAEIELENIKTEKDDNRCTRETDA